MITAAMDAPRGLVRGSRLLRKAKDERLLFLLANIIFSASTFAVTFILPYLLSREEYSSFVFAFQLALVLSTFLEFGISTSLLREYVADRFKAIRFSLFSETVLTCIVGVFLLAPAVYAERLLSTNTSAKSVLLAGAVSVVWIFNRARLVAEKRFVAIVVRSVLIAALRCVGIAAVFLNRGYDSYSLDALIALILILPFGAELPLRLGGIVRDTLHLLKSKELYVRRAEIVPLIIFSLSNYCVSALYVFASRYLFLYAEELKETQLLVDLGYAGSFVGVVTILNTTLRSYYIGSLSGDDPKALAAYVSKVTSKGVGFFAFNALAAVVAGSLVALLGSNTVSTASIWYAVIVVFSSGAVLYYGMMSLLAKTLRQQWVEVANNIIRVVSVVATVRWLLPISPLLTVLATNLLLILGEATLAQRMKTLVLGKSRI